MAIRSSDQTMFVWNNSNDPPSINGGELLTVDKCTGLAAEVNPAAAPQAGLAALAYNGTELFGADTDLYRINASTGVASNVSLSGRAKPSPSSKTRRRSERARLPTAPDCALDETA